MSESTSENMDLGQQIAFLIRTFLHNWLWAFLGAALVVLVGIYDLSRPSKMVYTSLIRFAELPLATQQSLESTTNQSNSQLPSETDFWLTVSDSSPIIRAVRPQIFEDSGAVSAWFEPSFVRALNDASAGEWETLREVSFTLQSTARGVILKTRGRKNRDAHVSFHRIASEIMLQALEEHEARARFAIDILLTRSQAEISAIDPAYAVPLREAISASIKELEKWLKTPISKVGASESEPDQNGLSSDPEKHEGYGALVAARVEKAEMLSQMFNRHTDYIELMSGGLELSRSARVETMGEPAVDDKQLRRELVIYLWLFLALVFALATPFIAAGVRAVRGAL